MVAVRQMCEKYLANMKNVFRALMDLEKAYDRKIGMVCGRCKECMELEKHC